MDVKKSSISWAGMWRWKWPKGMGLELVRRVPGLPAPPTSHGAWEDRNM